MAKKNEFANLNKGSKRIESALSNFIVNKKEKEDDDVEFNPLTDKKPRKKKTKPNEESNKNQAGSDAKKTGATVQPDGIEIKEEAGNKTVAAKESAAQEETEKNTERAGEGQPVVAIEKPETPVNKTEEKTRPGTKETPDDKPRESIEEPINEETGEENTEVQRETKKEKPAKIKRKPVLKPDAETLEKPTEEDEEDLYKIHTVVFSEGQLDKLRNVVNYKKWKQDPKYTIKEALHEAIQLFLKKRKPVEEFPDDFSTYTPKVSIKQFELFNRFIAEIRFKENPKYAIKYAIYEAVELYLEKNPVKL